MDFSGHQATNKRTYLDSSFLRNAGSLLPKRLEELALNTTPTTSVLTLRELIAESDKNDREFLRRRAALRGLQDARVSILTVDIWEKIFDAFDYFQSYELVGDSSKEELFAIWEEICCSDSLNDFFRSLRSRSLTEVFREIQGEDRRLARILTSDTAQLSRDIKLQFENTTTKERAELQELGLPPNGDLRNLITSTTMQAGLRWATIQGMLVSLHNEMDIEGFDVVRIMKTYNGRLDVFARAAGRLLDEQIITGNALGKNDAIDLLHFLWIESTDVLATLDSKMRNVASSIGVSLLPRPT